MNTPKQAILVLQEAEQRLRKLVASGAAAGEYDAIQQITDWAKILATMIREAQQIESAGDSARDAPKAPSASIAPAGLGKSSLVNREDEPPTHPRRRTPSRDQYPKFLRQGDQLVKIGWSKTTKGEYEHKASRRVVDALTTAIAKRSRNGKMFVVDDLLPLKDLLDQSEIPSYQAYVALAWLKLAGLVRQHGRRGYSVKKSVRISEATDALWQQLAEYAG